MRRVSDDRTGIRNAPPSIESFSLWTTGHHPTSLGTTHEIDDRHDHQDKDECSETDIHRNLLSWIATVGDDPLHVSGPARIRGSGRSFRPFSWTARLPNRSAVALRIG